MTNEIPVHEVCALLPEMDEDEYRALVKDIKENGQHEPIVLHEGEIIDGRHRARACAELGIQPDFTVWEGSGSLVRYVVSRNLIRRHLSAGQKALLAVPIARAFESEARARQGHRSDLEDENFPANLQESSEAAEMAASTVGVSPRSVYHAKRVIEQAPDVVPLVQSNTVSMNTAREIAALPEEARAPIVEAAKEQPAKEIRKQTRAARKAQAEALNQMSAAMFAAAGGDEDGKIARIDQQIAYDKALSTLMRCIRELDPEAVAGVVDDVDCSGIQSNLIDIRQWADAMENALRRPLRLVVGGNDRDR